MDDKHNSPHGVMGTAPALPRSDSEEAANGIEAVMAERNYPCAPKNAARVGWEAAFRWLRAHGVDVPVAPPPCVYRTGCQESAKCTEAGHCCAPFAEALRRADAGMKEDQRG